MTFAHACLIVQLATGVIAMFGVLVSIIRYRRIFTLKGKIISRCIVRALGHKTASHTQSFFFLFALGAGLVGMPLVVERILWIFWNVWIIDDWLTGDDDRWRRWRDKAKAKLRKIKPVRLRPAERWAPSPA